MKDKKAFGGEPPRKMVVSPPRKNGGEPPRKTVASPPRKMVVSPPSRKGKGGEWHGKVHRRAGRYSDYYLSNLKDDR